MAKFKYNSKPAAGKAHVVMNRNRYRVYVYDNVDDKGSTASLAPRPNDFHKADFADAIARAAELNDWQRLGTTGHEVYKGDATFNKAFAVEPWEHVYLTKDKVIIFVWDTREITRVYKRPTVDVLPYLHVEKSDNGKPICRNGVWLNQSDLEAVPVNAKTAKQAANEDDMAISTSDNTSMAPDVSTATPGNPGSGDTQQPLNALGAIAYTDGTNVFMLRRSGAMWQLVSMDGTVFDENKDKAQLFNNHKLRKL